MKMKDSDASLPGKPSAAEQIDAIVSMSNDWRGKMLSRLRSIIGKADTSIIEEVKWKKPSKPQGVPVWSLDGILCVADTLKSAVRLTFPKGAQIRDPKNIFNSRLDSKTVRAIDFRQGDSIDESALSDLIRAAVVLNIDNKKKHFP